MHPSHFQQHPQPQHPQPLLHQHQQQPVIPEIKGFDVATASQIGLQFIEKFYKALDENRSAIEEDYLPGAVINWNGWYIRPQDLLQIPASQHVLRSVNSHPVEIMIGSVELVAIAVQVSGTVQYGGDNDTRKLFSQSFLVLGIPQDNITVPRIMNDMLRWITPAIPPPPRQRYSHSQKRRDRTLVGGVGKKSKFAGKKKKKN